MSNSGISPWRSWCKRASEWVEAPRQQAFIIAAILLNSITLGLNTVPAVHLRFGDTLDLVDHVIIGVFVIEIILKLLYSGWRFFSNGWNIFDFLIVGIALLPASGVFSVLRTLRVLRVLRLLNKLRQLRLIVEAMMRSLPSLGWIAVLLSVLYFVFGIMGATLFGQDHPKLFGNLGITMYTLFELMTLEGWNSTAREVMETHPHAYLYFIPFLLLASYTLLNLVIGVIVTSMEGLHLLVHDSDIEPEPTTKELMLEIHRLHAKLDTLQVSMLEREMETEKM